MLLPFQTAGLAQFQVDWLTGAAKGVPEVVLSTPRANGKTFLLGRLLAGSLTPGGPHFRPAGRSMLYAGSRSQALLTLDATLDALGVTAHEHTGRKCPCGYIVAMSPSDTRLTHRASGAALIVRGTNARAALGLGANSPLVVVDEPAAIAENSGQLLYDAIRTSQGKAPMTAVYVGTRAPAQDGSWWRTLADSESTPHRRVTRFASDNPDDFDDGIDKVLRLNPLAAHNPFLKPAIINEYNLAQSDSALRAAFLSFRMNLPSKDATRVLLTVDSWRRICARPVPPRRGRSVVGVDLGANVSWTAAVAIWPNGRCEAFAVTSGFPNLRGQEIRDKAPAGSYQKLKGAGSLLVADGLHSVPPAHLIDEIHRRWGRPTLVICDRFRLRELADTKAAGWNVEPRSMMPSEATDAIRALRVLADDGALAADEPSRPLVELSLAGCVTKSHTGGNETIERKLARGNYHAQSDVAISLALAAYGHASRKRKARPAQVIHAEI